MLCIKVLRIEAVVRYSESVRPSKLRIGSTEYISCWNSIADWKIPHLMCDGDCPWENYLYLSLYSTHACRNEFIDHSDCSWVKQQPKQHVFWQVTSIFKEAQLLKDAWRARDEQALYCQLLFKYSLQDCRWDSYIGARTELKVFGRRIRISITASDIRRILLLRLHAL